MRLICHVFGNGNGKYIDPLLPQLTDFVSGRVPANRPFGHLAVVDFSRLFRKRVPNILGIRQHLFHKPTQSLVKDSGLVHAFLVGAGLNRYRILGNPY